MPRCALRAGSARPARLRRGHRARTTASPPPDAATSDPRRARLRPSRLHRSTRPGGSAPHGSTTTVRPLPRCDDTRRFAFTGRVAHPRTLCGWVAAARRSSDTSVHVFAVVGLTPSAATAAAVRDTDLPYGSGAHRARSKNKTPPSVTEDGVSKCWVRFTASGSVARVGSAGCHPARTSRCTWCQCKIVPTGVLQSFPCYRWPLAPPRKPVASGFVMQAVSPRRRYISPAFTQAINFQQLVSQATSAFESSVQAHVVHSALTVTCRWPCWSS